MGDNLIQKRPNHLIRSWSLVIIFDGFFGESIVDNNIKGGAFVYCPANAITSISFSSPLLKVGAVAPAVNGLVAVDNGGNIL